MSIITNQVKQPARIERYYDYHPVEGEEMGQNDFHFAAITHLVALLKWLYRDQPVYVAGELNLYRTSDPKEVPITPDVVLIKGIAPLEQRSTELPSYHIGVDGPPPTVVIEVSSPSTWRDDLGPKVGWYGAAGVAEYFAYDPHSTPLWTKEWRKYGRLAGWKLDPITSSLQKLPMAVAGQCWSNQLDSRLQIVGRTLNFYDIDGQPRLTEAETERAEKLREQRRAETERAEKLRERARAEKLAEFLRQNNFDPDKLV